MKKVYERALGVCYEILDQEAYERYWWGKASSTREAFEAWLKDPNATQVAVARRYGRMPNSIFKYVSKMMRLGILRRFKKTRT